MSEQKNLQHPPSAERVLGILDYFSNSNKPKSVKEISNDLNIPSASAYRVIRCLVDFGYLQESSEQSDKYNLGYKIMILAKSCSNNLPEIAFPFMEKLAKLTGQACQLSVLSENAIITISQAFPSSTITVIAKLGEKIPVNVSAAGKLLTALMPPERQRDFLKKAWNIITINTVYAIGDMEEYASKLPDISKKGYAQDSEEYAMGIGCLAVPIYDNTHTPIAAIGLTGQIENYRNESEIIECVKILRASSAEISDKLGYK